MALTTDPLVEIDRRRAEWTAHLSAGELNGYLRMMTDDVVWLPPRGAALVGVAELRAWLEPFLAQYRYDFSAHDVRTRVVGEHAFELGSYRSELTPVAGGAGGVHNGSYALFWRYDGDAGWRIERYADITDVVWNEVAGPGNG